MRVPVCVLAVMAAASCEGEITGVMPDAGQRPHPDHHVLLWVDPGTDLPAETLRRGCERWTEVGVGCDLVETAADSDVQVYAETDECDPDGDRSYVLAYASCCGPVVFRSDCFHRSDGTYDTEALEIVMGHEVGHAFGLWWHVPRDCAGTAPRDEAGEPICGKALMNPYFDPSVSRPLDPDLRAFAVRDPDTSVIDGHNHHDDLHGFATGGVCVYLGGEGGKR